jgi:hypothetical protein
MFFRIPGRISLIKLLKNQFEFKIYFSMSVVRIDKFLSVKTLVGFEIFVDFVRFVEQFFVGL